MLLRLVDLLPYFLDYRVKNQSITKHREGIEIRNAQQCDIYPAPAGLKVLYLYIWNTSSKQFLRVLPVIWVRTLGVEEVFQNKTARLVSMSFCGHPNILFRRKTYI